MKAVITMKLTKPKMMEEAANARGPKNIVLQILIFIAVFIVIAVAQNLVGMIFLLPDMINSMADLGDAMENVMGTDIFTLVMLFTTVIMTILAVVHCKFIEKRSLGSMGFRKRKALPHYAVGLFIGFALFALVYFICVAMGAIEIAAVGFNVNYGLFALFFAGFIFQGMSEEVLVRGYFMNTVGGKHSAALAVAVSSVVFSLLHGINPGITVLSLVNIALYGVLMGVYMICFDDIWGVCGIHTMWNFVQGNVFGILVSGINVGDSIITSNMNEDMTLINGGDFGIEGGIITTAVLIAAIAPILVYYRKKSQESPSSAE